METGSDKHRQVLAQQLAMNRQTWQALKHHGVTEDSRLRLEFFYIAPGKGQADTLARFIRAETDYAVDAHAVGGGFLKKKEWMVNGSTQPTQVSQEILDQWVTWMVAAGLDHGCEFDGWGAEAG